MPDETHNASCTLHVKFQRFITKEEILLLLGNYRPKDVRVRCGQKSVAFVEFYSVSDARLAHNAIRSGNVHNWPQRTFVTFALSDGSRNGQQEARNVSPAYDDCPPGLGLLDTKCIRCQKLSCYFCRGCGQYYCSVECQWDHWPSHKSLCRGRTISAVVNAGQVKLSMPERTVQSRPVANEIYVPKSTPERVTYSKPEKCLPQSTPERVTQSNVAPERVAQSKPHAGETCAPQSTPEGDKKQMLLNKLMRSSPQRPTARKFTAAELKLQNLVDGAEVVITSFDSGAVYVNQADDEQGILELTAQIQDYCSKDVSLRGVEVGDIVGALFDDDETFYRAHVVEITGQMAKLFYVDYGNTSSVALNKIKLLDQSFQKYPQFTIPWKFKTTATYDTIQSFLESLVDTLGTVKKDQHGSYDIIIGGKGSLRKCFANFDEPEWKKRIRNREAVFPEDYVCPKIMDIPTEQLGASGVHIAAQVLFVYGADVIQIAVADEAKDEQLASLEANMTEFGNAVDADKAYKPEIEDVVLVLADDRKWHRAQVVNVSVNDTLTVAFVDQGTIEYHVPLDRIRYIHPDFLNMQARAILCELEGGDNIPDDSPEVILLQKAVERKFPINFRVVCPNGESTIVAIVQK